MGLLSVAIWLPIAVGALLLALGRDGYANTVRWVALIGAVAGFLVTLPLVTRFDVGSAAMQFQENVPWIERFNVAYRLGVDGISVWFVLLTAFITVIVDRGGTCGDLARTRGIPFAPLLTAPDLGFDYGT